MPGISGQVVVVGCQVEGRGVEEEASKGCEGRGDTERISVYVDNHKSHLSTLERVLTNAEEGGKVRSTL